jgi:hypothetical protein
MCNDLTGGLFMNNEEKAVFGAWIQAIGTILSAIASTPSITLREATRNDLDILGNVLQATGNALEADTEKYNLNKLGNMIQSIGNSTVLIGLLSGHETTEKELSTKGNLLQALGGGLVFVYAIEQEPSYNGLYAIYGNLLQAIGNSLQALSPNANRNGKNGQTLDFIGSWIQAIGAVISVIGQTKSNLSL